MTHFEIVKKLIGEIDPIGETNEDNKRFENLKKMCELTNELVKAIDEVAYRNKDRIEYSMKKAADYADLFLSQTLGIEE